MITSTWNGATGNWRDAADWSNGVPDGATDADFTAAGAYTVTLSRSDAFSAAAVVFDAASASLALEGSLSVAGVFDLKAGTLMMSKAGVIHGGTLMMDGGTLVSQGGIGSRGGTLDGVRLAGTLDLAAGVETLNIRGGLIGTGAGARIDLSGGEDSLKFVGGQTIDHVTIIVDNPNTYSVVYTTGTLTLGASATLTTTAVGPYAVLTGARVVNDGSIVSGASGAQGTFNIGLRRGFINNGIVAAASNMTITSPEVVNGAAGTISIGSFISLLVQGGFTNRGAMTIASGGSVDVSSTTRIANSGTITVGSGNLSLDQGAGPGVAAFTNTGTISVGQQGSMSLLLNFTVASLGNVTDAGRLYIGGTLDNAGGTLQLGSGPLFGGAGITLGYGGLISGGTAIVGGAHLTYAGGGLANLTLQGALDLGAAKAAVNLDGGVTITAADGRGAGHIALTGAGAVLSFLDAPGVSVNAIDNVTIIAGNAHAGVAIDLVALDGPSLTLTLGAHARTVSGRAGARVMLQTQFPTAGSLVNLGHIDAIAAGGAFTVSILTFENDGQVLIANGEVFTLIGALTGSGHIELGNGGIAQLGATAATQSVNFIDAADTLKLSDAGQFAATLSGAVAGDRIDLIKTAATAASVNASDQLVITDKGATVATLQLTGDYSHTTFTVGGDGAGGSLITLAGAAPVHALVAAAAAMAGLGGAVAAPLAVAGADDHRPSMVQLAGVQPGGGR